MFTLRKCIKCIPQMKRKLLHFKPLSSVCHDDIHVLPEDMSSE